MPKVFFNIIAIGFLTLMIFMSFNFFQNIQAQKSAASVLGSLTLQSSVADLLPKIANVSEVLSQETNELSLQVKELKAYDDVKTQMMEDLEVKIDLLEKKLAALQKEQKQMAKSVTTAKVQPKKSQSPANKEILTEPKDIIVVSSQAVPTPTMSTTTVATKESTYPKLLISEIQIAGADDEKEEFVELYNPTGEDVDLTGWYIHRKTKTSQGESTFASNTLFKDKKILASGYFLVAREGYFTNLADVFISSSLTEDNSLLLKNPDGQVVDLVGWGQAQDFESSPAENPPDGQSMVRAQGLDSDNNADDFIIHQPTPKLPSTSFQIDPIISLPADDATFQTPTDHQVVKIVINEVQTEGKTAKDEFIELYNPTNNDVDLTRFSLKKKTASGSESNLVSATAFSGIIPKLGYFLIVPRVNDDGTPNFTGSVTPDLYYSGKSFSVADNNTILLYDKEGSLLDKVGFGTAQDFENSPASNPDSLKSISRKGPGQDTNDNSQDFTISDPSTPKE